MARIGIWISLLVSVSVVSFLGIMQAGRLDAASQPSWLLFLLFMAALLASIASVLFTQSRIDFWETQYRSDKKQVTFEQMKEVYSSVDSTKPRLVAQLFVSLGIAAGFYLSFVGPVNPTEIEFSVFGNNLKARTDLPALLLLVISLIILACLTVIKVDVGSGKKAK